MRLIEKAYAAAKEDLKLDWKEKPGPAVNKLITECYKAVDGFGNPEMMDDSVFAWCSCFVNKKIQDAGGRGTRSAAARSWLRWGAPCLPVEGCIVVFKRGKSTWQGHVAFVQKIDEDYVWCLGGNQADTVKVSRYNRADVLDFRTSKD